MDILSYMIGKQSGDAEKITKEELHDAVDKGWITEEQYQKIVGEDE